MLWSLDQFKCSIEKLCYSPQGLPYPSNIEMLFQYIFCIYIYIYMCFRTNFSVKLHCCYNFSFSLSHAQIPIPTSTFNILKFGRNFEEEEEEDFWDYTISGTHQPQALPQARPSASWVGTQDPSSQ